MWLKSLKLDSSSSVLFGVETLKRTKTSVRTAVYVTPSNEHFIVSSLLSYCTVMALKTIIDQWTKINPNFNSLLPGWSAEKIDPCVGSAWLGVFCYADYSGTANYSSDYSTLYVPVVVGGMWVTATICNAFSLLSLDDSPAPECGNGSVCPCIPRSGISIYPSIDVSRKRQAG